MLRWGLMKGRVLLQLLPLQVYKYVGLGICFGCSSGGRWW